METKNNVVENKEIKTLNQLLNRIHCRIKKDVQWKQINYIQNILEAEKNNIIENKFFIWFYFYWLYKLSNSLNYQ